MSNQPTEYAQVFDNNTGGGQFGRTTSDKIGFYGTAPIAQPAISSAVSTTSTISTAGAWGFSTQSEINQVVAAVSTIAAQLKALGLCV